MLSLMVLDDERIIRQGIVKIIRENIPEVSAITECGSGEECLSYLETSPVDLLLTDIRLDGIDGLELLQIIRRKEWNMDVILISGYSDFEYCRKAICYQAYDYLLKPVDKAELIRIVRGYAAQFRTRSDFGENTTASQHQTVKEIKKYIRANYQNRLSMEELGERFFLNANYISQLFKKEEKCAISVYILRIRMEMARIHLEDCTKQIAEVARLVGYDSPKQFTMAFKKYFGHTPSEYRRQHGNEGHNRKA